MWAFGFGCSLARLGLRAPDLDLEQPGSVPRLPPPLETFLWTPEAGWAPRRPLDAPPDLRARLPSDGREPCRTFVPRLQRRAEATYRLRIGGDAAPFVTAVSDGEDGVVLLVSPIVVDTRTDPPDVRITGGQLFWIPDPSTPIRRLPAGDVLRMPLALASRGGGTLLVAGPEGAVEGALATGFQTLSPFPRLDGQEHVALAVSPRDADFEAFVLARAAHPVERVQSRLTLYRVTRDGVETATSAVVLPRTIDQRERRPDAVVRAGPGEAFALGFSSGPEILHVRNGEARLETFSETRSAPPVGLAHHPGVGTLLLDARGRAFLRPKAAPGDGPWVELDGPSENEGPLGLARLDDTPAFPVLSRDAGGVRFVFARPEGGVCATPVVPFGPVTDPDLEAGNLAVVSGPDRAWWLLTSAGSRIVTTRVALSGRAGECAD